MTVTPTTVPNLVQMAQTTRTSARVCLLGASLILFPIVDRLIETYLYSAYKFKRVTKRFGRQINEFSKIV